MMVEQTRTMLVAVLLSAILCGLGLFLASRFHQIPATTRSSLLLLSILLLLPASACAIFLAPYSANDDRQDADDHAESDDSTPLSPQDSMALWDSLNAIFGTPRQDDEDFTQSEAIDGLIALNGWRPVCEAVLQILSSVRPKAEYQLAAETLWHGVCGKRQIPADRAIALLYFRLDPTGTDEDNLVWSITCSLRRVGYMSDYKPLEDPRIQEQLALIQRTA